MHLEATLAQEPFVTCAHVQIVQCTASLCWLYSRFHPLLDAFVPLLSVSFSAEGPLAGIIM